MHRVLIGIATCNDVETIHMLLSSLSDDLPSDWHVMIISSGNDETGAIVQSFMETNDRIQMIQETVRRGKVNVLNRLLRIVDTEGYDALVFLGGDNLTNIESIKKMIQSFEEDDRLGVIGGHPIPICRRNKSFVNLYYEMQWKIHHLISEDVKPKISGELMAIRAGVIHELPPAIINDDTYVEAIAEIKGYKTAYAPESTVYLYPPRTLRDMIAQRRRIYIGHHQVRMITGIKPATAWFLNVKYALKTIRSWKDATVLLLSILMQAAIYLLAKIDFIRGYLPYKWKIVQSAKKV